MPRSGCPCAVHTLQYLGAGAMALRAMSLLSVGVGRDKRWVLRTTQCVVLLPLSGG